MPELASDSTGLTGVGPLLPIVKLKSSSTGTTALLPQWQVDDMDTNGDKLRAGTATDRPKSNGDRGKRQDSTAYAQRKAARAGCSPTSSLHTSSPVSCVIPYYLLTSSRRASCFTGRNVLKKWTTSRTTRRRSLMKIKNLTTRNQALRSKSASSSWRSFRQMSKFTLSTTRRSLLISRKKDAGPQG